MKRVMVSIVVAVAGGFIREKGSYVRISREIFTISIARVFWRQNRSHMVDALGEAAVAASPESLRGQWSRSRASIGCKPRGHEVDALGEAAVAAAPESLRSQWSRSRASIGCKLVYVN